MSENKEQYAIIETGGKQYRVEKGARLKVETLPGEAGGTIDFSQVLLVSGGEGQAAKIGQPYLAGSKVSASIVKQFRAPKVMIFKKRSKKGYKKQQGHRQYLTEVEVKEILA